MLTPGSHSRKKRGSRRDNSAMLLEGLRKAALAEEGNTTLEAAIAELDRIKPTDTAAAADQLRQAS